MDTRRMMGLLRELQADNLVEWMHVHKAYAQQAGDAFEALCGRLIGAILRRAVEIRKEPLRF